MDWWSELWLNEGFATWVGWLAVAHFYPGKWLSRYLLGSILGLIFSFPSQNGMSGLSLLYVKSDDLLISVCFD